MLHQIGVGALGPVFRTYEPARDRLVAVKVFRLDITPEVSQALADELAGAAEAGLFHPSIVEPIAAGVQGTVAYRAEEYVPAESLDVAMRHYAPAAPGKVLPFIAQLAGAIDFARASGVGHGALHPRDVFVTPDEARVTGFGVVDALEKIGLRAPVRRPYTPPERVAGEPWGTAADVFSLAAIAFEMLTGRRPSGTGADIGEIKEALPGPQADRLRAVLAQAMDEDPARRFPSALAFAEALETAARGDAAADSPTAAAPAAVSPIPDPVDRKATARQATRDSAEPDRPAVEGVAPAPAPPPEVEKPVRLVKPTEPPPEAAAPDDVAAEREEDEAFWRFSQEQPAGPISKDADVIRSEAPAGDVERADRVALDAADLALEESSAPDRRFAREFEVETAPATADTPRDRPRVDSPHPPRDRAKPPAGPAARATPPIVPPPREAPVPMSGTLFQHDPVDRLRGEEESGESRIVGHRARPAMLPLAITLILGLLVGFAAGYAVGSRPANPPGALPTDAAANASPPDSSQPAADSSAAGKEWSEGTVPSEARGAAPAATPAEPDPPALAPPTGRIEVRSTPSRAAVTVNGKWSGRTPLTLSDLAFGDYVVRIVAEGYRVGREEFALSPGSASRRISMRLEREAPASRSARSGGATPAPARSEPAAPRSYVGSVFVDSRPQGATVYIDSKPFGKTPIRIPEVAIGSHVVRLELPDHRTWTTAVRVPAGAQVRVTGSLEPVR